MCACASSCDPLKLNPRSRLGYCSRLLFSGYRTDGCSDPLGRTSGVCARSSARPWCSVYGPGTGTKNQKKLQPGLVPPRSCCCVSPRTNARLQGKHHQLQRRARKRENRGASCASAQVASLLMGNVRASVMELEIYRRGEAETKKNAQQTTRRGDGRSY